MNLTKFERVALEQLREQRPGGLPGRTLRTRLATLGLKRAAVEFYAGMEALEKDGLVRAWVAVQWFGDEMVKLVRFEITNAGAELLGPAEGSQVSSADSNKRE